MNFGLFNTAISFSPFWPLWLIAVIFGFGLLLALANGLRLVSVTRCLGIAFLALALLNPTLQIDETEPEKTIVVLADDASASNQITPRAARTQTALEQLRQDISAQDSLELVEVEVGNSPEGTDLAAAITERLQALPAHRIGAVIAATDGIVRSGSLPLDEGVPLHGLLSYAEMETDRAIKLINQPRFAPVGSQSSVSFSIETFGTLSTTPVFVELRQAGDVIARLQAEPNKELTLPLPVPLAGKNQYILSVENDESELTVLNNALAFEIEGTRDTLKVLLVSGAPHAGQRAWRDILKSDPAVDLIHFTILRPPFKQDGVPVDQLALIAFPTYELFEQKLHEFDLVIFDRYQRIGVLPRFYFENIADYVQNGGALLVMSGPEYAGFDTIYDTALERVLPATPSGQIFEQPYHVRLSDLGQRHPISRVLPGAYAQPPSWGRWYRTIEATVLNGKVLMQDEQQLPILVVAQQGEGRVAQMLSDHSWLWTRGVESGGPYAPLIRRLVHWLMKEPELESEQLQLESRAARGTGALRTSLVRQTEAQDAPPLSLEGPDGTQTLTMQIDTPGQWRTDISALPAGIYKATQGDVKLDFLRLPDAPQEYASLKGSSEILAAMAQTTSFTTLDTGTPQILRVSGSGRLSGRGWIGVKDRGAVGVVSTLSLPLLNGLLGLSLICLVMGLVWGTEGRKFRS